ncbi:MAG: carboxypeptidase regulatory-like domain-containing protein, partial [Prevotellaceae bacterium]|nr:carboxypeptidase regulatory-like domain-containing protein [Prevotellaceae bacterium]
MLCYVSIAACSLMFSTCGSGNSGLTEEAPRTYAVSGAITKSDGGAAAGASVMLVRTSDDSDAGQSPTNAAGEYIVTSVAAGSYKIVATLNGYETGSIDAVKIVDADVTGNDMVLQKITAPTYAIGGAVTTPDGSAASGASVQVRRASDNTPVGQATTTDASGEYSISDIPAGEYYIVIALDGYETGILESVTVSSADLTAQSVALKTITVSANAISITYSGNEAIVSNLPFDGSVTATKSGADVTVTVIVTSSSSGDVELYVSGATSGGSLKIQNNASAPNTLRLTLSSAVITSTSKLPPIQITKNEGVTIVELKGSSILSDHSTNEENATLISKSGSLEFEGYGKLAVSGAAKHAIASSKKSITVRGG